MADAPKHIHDQQAADGRAHPLIRAIKYATYPVAGLAAYLVGRTETRKGIYKNFVSAGAFKDIQPKHREEILNIMKDAEAGLKVNGPELVEGYHDAYRALVREKFEAAGFHNIADYWSALHPNQKTNALVFAAGAAGLVITTSLAFVNNKQLLQHLTAKEAPSQPDK